MNVPRILLLLMLSLAVSCTSDRRSPGSAHQDSPGPGHNSAIQLMAFSPGGQYLASADSMGFVKIWRVSSRGLQADLPRINAWGTLQSLAVDDRARVRVLINAGYEYSVWDSEKKGVILRKKCPGLNFGALSGNGKIAALVLKGKKEVFLWDLEGKRALPPLKGQKGEMVHVALTPDGRYAAAGGYLKDPSARVWDVNTGREIRSFSPGSEGVFRVALSRDGALLITEGYDKVLSVWNVKTGKKVSSSPHTGQISHLSLSRDGKRLGMPGFSWFYSFMIRDAENGKALYTHKEKYGTGDSLVMAGHLLFSPAEDLMVFVEGQGNLVFWDVRKEKPVARIEGRYTGYARVVFDRNGRFAAARSQASGRIVLWNAADFGFVREIDDGHEGGSLLGFSADGKEIISWVSGGVMKFWELKGGDYRRETLSVEGGGGYAYMPSLSNNGDTLACLTGKTAVAWVSLKGLENNARRMRIPAGGRITALKISDDGKIFACGLEEGGLYLLNAEGEVQHHIKRGHRGSVRSLAFSPDGNLLVSGGGTPSSAREKGDFSVNIWDVERGKLLKKGRGHREPVIGLVFLPGGEQFLSFSGDGLILFWSNRGQILRRVEDQYVTLQSFRLSPDGTRLCVTGRDSRGAGVMEVWTLNPWKKEKTLY